MLFPRFGEMGERFTSEPGPARAAERRPGRRLREVLSAYSEPGVVDRTGPSVGIAFSELLLHSWDLARAPGQDATMPAGLAEADELIQGMLGDSLRNGMFKPEIPIGDDASAQDRLLAFTGRKLA
jgi:uncharacterized protein (TIGR03086 family)